MGSWLNVKVDLLTGYCDMYINILPYCQENTHSKMSVAIH